MCLVCYNDIEQGYGDFCSRCHKWYDIDDKYKWYTKDVDTDMVRICLKCLSIDFLLSFFYYPKGRKKE